jgi:antirestriction protein ArdC
MARNLYSEVTSRILADLEAGAAPWVKPWRALGHAGQPRNGATNRPYSGVNVVLIWQACQANIWTDYRFVTFKQALELGGNVKKGEKGTKIYFVSTIERTEEGEAGEDGKIRRIPFLKEYTVFNVAQCEGLRLDAIAAPATEAERDTLADEFLAATGAAIVEGSGEAYYRPGTDQIAVPHLAAFKSREHFYCTMFHELGHWTGAKHRLARDFSGRFGSQAYAGEELVAELTAAFLCAEFGIDGDLRHAGYIEHWTKLLRSDERAFFTAASAAQKAADYLRGLALAEPAAIAA